MTLKLLNVSSLQERIQDALRESSLKNATALAKKAGVSRATVTLWKNGPTQTIEGDNLTRAAAALGVNAHWLATGEGPRYLAGNTRAAEPAVPYGKITTEQTILLRKIRALVSAHPAAIRETASVLLGRYLVDDTSDHERELIEAALERLLQH